MSGLKKAGKALREAYQDALPGKGNTTKALTVTHTTHEGETPEDGEVVVHISGPEADGLAAYAKLFPGDAFSLAHPDGVIVHTATVERKTGGAESDRTHHSTITHYVTSY